MLEQLIQIELLLGKTTADDNAKGAVVADARYSQIKSNATSDEMLDRQLKLVGMTQVELKKRLTEESIREAVLKRELKAEATDADAKKFYDENPSKFEQPEQVRASHVLIATGDQKTGTDLNAEQKAKKRELAESILKRARTGEDFAKLAKEYSDDPGSKDKGGEYTFPRGQMVADFEAAAFALKTNEVSEIVTTQFGYHIIKLSEKIPAKRVEFSKVSERIKEVLSAEAMSKKMKPYFEKLKKDAEVKVLDEKLAAINPYADDPSDSTDAPPAPKAK